MGEVDRSSDTRQDPIITAFAKSDEHGSRGVGSLRRPGFCWLEYLLSKSVFQWSDVASKATSARIPANGSITLPAKSITRKRGSIGSQESVGSARRPMLKSWMEKSTALSGNRERGTTGSSAFRRFSPQPLRSRPTWNDLGSRLWRLSFLGFIASIVCCWTMRHDEALNHAIGESYQLISLLAQEKR